MKEKENDQVEALAYEVQCLKEEMAELTGAIQDLTDNLKSSSSNLNIVEVLEQLSFTLETLKNK